MVDRRRRALLRTMAITGSLGVAGWLDTSRGGEGSAPPAEEPTTAGRSTTEPPSTGLTRSTPTPEGNRDTRFGERVALSGDTAFIGSPHADVTGRDSGAVHVFERGEDGWARRAILAPPDGDVEEQFGARIALVGDTALVSTQHDEEGTGDDTGVVHTFERIDGGWTRVDTLAVEGPTPAGFGYAIALSSATAFVGAPGEDLGSSSDAGTVYVFEQTESGWSRRAKLTKRDNDAGDGLGGSVVATEKRILVGAPGETVVGVDGGGAVYVFEWSDDGWSWEARLTREDAPDSDPFHDAERFGAVVALSGDTAFVGVPDVGFCEHPDTRGCDDVENTGGTYVFERSEAAWTHESTLKLEQPGPGDRFGESIDRGETLVLVGAPGNGGPYAEAGDPGTGQGVGYVYERSNGDLTRDATLALTGDGDHEDAFGSEVSLSGRTALFSAPGDEDTPGTDTGSVHVFERSGGGWSKQARLTSMGSE